MVYITAYIYFWSERWGGIPERKPYKMAKGTWEQMGRKTLRRQELFMTLVWEFPKLNYMEVSCWEPEPSKWWVFQQTMFDKIYDFCIFLLYIVNQHVL